MIAIYFKGPDGVLKRSEVETPDQAREAVIAVVRNLPFLDGDLVMIKRSD